MNWGTTVRGRLFGLLFAAALAAGVASHAAAQTKPPPIPAYFNLIERLNVLAKLPDGTWKVHAGAIPHGETPGLDDSSWAGLADWKPSSAAAFEGVWFRQTYTVPRTIGGYDMTGARVWFHFSRDRQIVYFNGRRVALGEDLEPIVLFENARPGDTVAVAVKVLPDPRNDDRFKAATLRVEFPSAHPAPDDIRKEFQSAVLLIPSFAPGDQAKLDALAALILATGSRARIQVDGNVSPRRIPELLARGASLLVGGTSAIFRPGAVPADEAGRVRRALDLLMAAHS